MITSCTYLYLYRLSPWSDRTSFLLSNAHWRRYFGIKLREGSQVLPGKTPVCRKFSTDALTERPEATGCWNKHLLDFHQSPFSQVVALIPLGPDQSSFGGPTRNQSSQRHSSLPRHCHVEEGLDFNCIAKLSES